MTQGPPPVPGERTPEEREAARREREARRAARRDDGAATPAGRRTEAPDGQGAAPADTDWLEEARRFTQRGAGGEEDTDGPRIARLERVPRAPAGGRSDRGHDPPPAATASGRARRVRVGRLIFALTGLVLILLGAWFVVSLLQPAKGDGEGQRVRVVVPRGAGVAEIGDLLERKGIVASSFFFQTRARLAGRTGSLKPGSYRLRRDMSYAAVLDALEKGTPPSIVVLTIPEGRSRREVARLVRGKLEGDYLRATRRSRVLDPRDYGAERARDLEGFLFPATYELKRGKPMRALVDQQLETFRQKSKTVDMRYARSKNLTRYDVLIIASLVEREVQVPKERRLVASVIYNRLHQGMPLGIDATVRFVTGNWERPLRKSELANRSPYNTRRGPGLPPGPIGSPGLASIEAAAHPARTGYLFYVVKPGGNGAHAFSKTDAEFQRDVERYNRERKRRGGKSPAAP
jgi:UPF0755 protein